MSDGTFYFASAVVMCVSIWVLAKVAGWIMREAPRRDEAIATAFDAVDEHLETAPVDDFAVWEKELQS